MAQHKEWYNKQPEYLLAGVCAICWCMH